MLYIHPLLHAKLYRFDDLVLIGSANITRRALGWTAPANVEILISPKEALGEMRAFEENLIDTSVLANSTLRDNLREKVNALAAASPVLEELFESETREVLQTWLPTCRVPNRLWNIYSNFEPWRLVEAAAEAAKADLAALNIPSGLSKEQFNQFVRATLERMPFVQQIETAAANGLSSEAAAAMIGAASNSTGLPYSATEMWEVLQAWLIYFFPGRFRREPAGEMFRQGRVIG